jgi:enoyl-CoA hydratase/carnithine racemase
MNTVIDCSKKESVAIITFCRSKARNTIGPRMSAELKDIRTEIQRDKTVKVAVLTGEGQDVFCKGTDLAEFYALENKADGIALFSVASIIAAFDCPTIAAINGDAIGQGLELAEMPWDGGTQRLARLVGRAKALELILLGETVDAPEAHRIGLVHKVIPPDDLISVVMDLAQKMAAKSPLSLAYVKEAIHKGMDLTLQQGMRLEADLYYLIHTTEDRTEGIKAFREKRRPQFKGK